ncbi:MAG: hypothetical protein Q7U74_06700, partial [Saprospiraceae bacterium]|nr:hypothetical protein [Saprospiraceae bacterium]
AVIARNTGSTSSQVFEPPKALPKTLLFQNQILNTGIDDSRCCKKPNKRWRGLYQAGQKSTKKLEFQFL